jgi:RimJ/RimL family protein N-acetyltransferase
MSNFPDTFVEETLPLTKAIVGESSAEAFDKLAHAGYEVHAGLNPEYASAIIEMALDPAIREYCPNDSGSRFKDQAAVEAWLGKKRGTFLLLKKESKGGLVLVGYGWAGDAVSSHVPGGETTFAIRIGKAGQGQGLAVPFAQMIVAGAAILYGAQKMWLETWGSNAGAVHVYHKIGFKDVDQQDDHRPTNDGETIADTRIYMSLADEFLPKKDAALSSVS